MIIAICGTEHNTGVTHFALALSNYLCSKLRKKVAYLEVNASNEISALCQRDPGNCKSFRKKGFMLFPNVTLAILPNIFALGFDFHVLDFGVLNSNTFKDYMRADVCFLLGYYSPWKQRQNQSFFSHYEEFNLLNRAILLEAFHDCVQKSKAKKKDGEAIQVLGIPYLENPFHLTTLDLAFYQNLTNEFLLLPQTRKRLL